MLLHSLAAWEILVRVKKKTAIEICMTVGKENDYLVSEPVTL